MRLPAALTLFVVAIASLRAEAPDVKGTMPEDYLPGLTPLLKAAVERSPSVLSANIAVAVAEATRYQNAAALWPSLGLNASYGSTRESVSGGMPNTQSGFFYSANLNQNIFQFGALKNQAEIARISEQIAERRFGDAYQQVADTIRTQYLGLIAKKISIRNERFVQKMKETDLAAQQVRFEAGSASDADVDGYKLQLEEQKLATDRAVEDFEYAKQLFLRLVGVESLDDNSIPIEVPHPEFKPELADAVVTGFVGGGVESTFQSQVYQMTVKEDDLNYKIAAVRLLPKIYGSALYALSNQSTVGGNTVTQSKVQEESYSIAANWAIFDGFATKGAKLSALASKRADELQKKTYVDTSIDTIMDTRRELGFTARAMVFAERHNKMIEGEVKRLGDDKSLGYASEATVDAGILTLNSTQFLMANARAEFFRRWVDFISLAGIDPAEENLPSRYAR